MNNRATINLNDISKVNKFVNEMSKFEKEKAHNPISFI